MTHEANKINDESIVCQKYLQIPAEVVCIYVYSYINVS